MGERLEKKTAGPLDKQSFADPLTFEPYPKITSTKIKYLFD